jgi:hypothetical protein
MSDRLTPEREAEIAARAEAATPGPWEEHPKYGSHFFAYLGGSYLRGVGTLNFGEGDGADADRALTVNAQTDLTALLAELAAVRAERDQARRDAELQRASYFREAARLLEDAGRDDDSVNLLDNVAAGIHAQADDASDNRRRIYIDGKGDAWISVCHDEGTEWVVPVRSARQVEQDVRDVADETGSLREIGRCW